MSSHSGDIYLLTREAEENDRDALYNKIREDPQILKKIDDIAFVNTPLHVAASTGNTLFVTELMTLMPSFCRKLNCDGLSPLHLALQKGHLETAWHMIKLDSGLIRVPGREMKTPMHHLVAISKDNDEKKLDLLIDFLWACPEAVKDVTVDCKTPLHVALDSKSLNAFEVLFGWVCRTGQKSLLNEQDIAGNNLMHLAAHTDQDEYHFILQRLKGMVFLTKNNLEGLTPLQIAQRANNKKAVEILKSGKERGKLIPKERDRRIFFMSPETFSQKVLGFIARMQRGMTMEERNVVLVVAVLVATATYQVVLQPPSGVTQERPVHSTTEIVRSNLKLKMSTRSLMLNVFMPLNTLAFNLSLAAILFTLPLDIRIRFLPSTLIVMWLSYIVAMHYMLEHQRLSLAFAYVSCFMLALAYVVYYAIYELQWDLTHPQLLKLRGRQPRARQRSIYNLYLQKDTVLRSLGPTRAKRQ